MWYTVPWWGGAGTGGVCSDAKFGERDVAGVAGDIDLVAGLALQAGFAGTRVKMVKSTLRHGVCCVRQLNILLALNEIIQ